MQEAKQVGSLGQEDPREEGVANPLSILARRVLWTEEPGGHSPEVLQNVKHDWGDLAQHSTHRYY